MRESITVQRLHTALQAAFIHQKGHVSHDKCKMTVSLTDQKGAQTLRRSPVVRIYLKNVIIFTASDQCRRETALRQILKQPVSLHAAQQDGPVNLFSLHELRQTGNIIGHAGDKHHMVLQHTGHLADSQKTLLKERKAGGIGIRRDHRGQISRSHRMGSRSLFLPDSFFLRVCTYFYSGILPDPALSGQSSRNRAFGYAKLPCNLFKCDGPSLLS